MRTNKLRLVLRGLAGIMLCAAVLVAPNVFFYMKWMKPTEALPGVETLPPDSVASTTLTEQQALANRELIVRAIEAASLPSMSAAIAYEGGLQWSGAAGYADIANAEPATVSSRYRLGSVSKSLTATVLARLIDNQMITLDEPAATYFPSLPSHYAGVTPRMLASHTAGVRHYPGMPTWWLGWHPAISGQNYASVEEGLSVFINEELLFAPGSGFEYSTYGYSLLSRLMEGAAGRSFEELLHDELFTPAGMTDTAVDHEGAMANRVAFYGTGDGKYTAAYPSNSSYKIAGGGIVSTPRDLAVLGQALLAGDLVSDASRKLLWTPVELPDGKVNPQNYGLGWRINESTKVLADGQPVVIVHHGGSQNGGAAYLLLIPEYGVSVAATTNSGSDEARGKVEEVCLALARAAIAGLSHPEMTLH